MELLSRKQELLAFFWKQFPAQNLIEMGIWRRTGRRIPGTDLVLGGLGQKGAKFAWVAWGAWVCTWGYHGLAWPPNFFF